MRRATKAISRLSRLGLAVLAARREGRHLGGLRERAAWQQRQARRMLAALEVEVEVAGRLPDSGMIVCNHLGYLDVLAIAAMGHVAFVSKAAVRDWPVIGRLLECAGTILADRHRPLSSAATVAQIRDVLEAGVPVVLFPEGTSTDGSGVLPFKPTLLQPALDAGAAVTPAAIFYHAEGGDAAHDVCYWGDHSFATHLMRLARLRRVSARIQFGTAGRLPDNRKDAAKALHAEVVGLLRSVCGRDPCVRQQPT